MSRLSRLMSTIKRAVKRKSKNLKIVLCISAGFIAIFLVIAGHRSPDNDTDHKSRTNDIRSRLQARSQHLTMACQMQRIPVSNKTINTHQLYRHFYINEQYKFLYCAVEKVGSSYWKRILKILVHSVKQNNHLFDIPSWKAHKGLSHANILPEQVQDIQKHYLSFMFARDPFTRLYSAYLDKLLLPNALKDSLTHTIKKWKGIPDRTCTNTVTFADICDYVASLILQKRSLEDHLAPISTHCQPCFWKFSFIGKLETFAEDTSEILEVLGIKNAEIYGEVTDPVTENERKTIQDLTDRTFKYMNTEANCTTRTQVLQQLWDIFQAQGYISKKFIFPPKFLHGNNTFVKYSDFMKAARYWYQMSKGQPERIGQRNEALHQAFRTVPKHVLKKLKRAFARECALFNYSCNVTQWFLTS